MPQFYSTSIGDSTRPVTCCRLFYVRSAWVVLKLCSNEFELAPKTGETWIDDREVVSSRLSFKKKGKHQIWFAYGHGSPFAYAKPSLRRVRRPQAWHTRGVAGYLGIPFTRIRFRLAATVGNRRSDSLGQAEIKEAGNRIN